MIVGAALASVCGCASDASDLPDAPFGVWAAPVAVTAFGGDNFAEPQGLAVDTAGDVYVADYLDNVIRAITPTGIATTLAGTGNDGAVNGPGSTATFLGPEGVAVDAAGNVYVADTHNHLLRKVTPEGEVSTFAGTGDAGNANGASTAASFQFPEGIAVDASGNVYVADTGNNLIRKVTPAGDVSTLAGTGAAGSADGAGSAASFNQPYGVAVDAAGNLFVGDSGNGLIRKVTPAGEVSTVVAIAANGVAVDTAGNLYVACDGAPFDASSVQIVTPGGVASTYAQGFMEPTGVAVDASGNVYAADFLTNLVSKISQLGTGQLAVTWDRVDSSIDAPDIAYYTATARAAGQPTKTCKVRQPSCTITGLASGIEYNVTVTANNGVDGPPSSPVTAIPN
ncbi:MAG TPA: fibronectin type III domain-containing protein [Kofleriaceae bacterium]|nr:fibronectin type III domain-containing protein [Kofleriaceae bacterium]